jgi:hypothetical protein
MSTRASIRSTNASSSNRLQREPRVAGAAGASALGQQAAEANGRGNAQLPLRLVAVARQRLVGRCGRQPPWRVQPSM